MPGNIVNIGWLNQNALRAYPLSESATRQDTTATYTLPDNFLVDFVLSVNASLNYEPANFYLSKLSIFGAGVTLEFSYWTSTTQSIIGTVSLQISTFTSNTVYYLQGQDDFEGVLGKVVVGTLDTVLEQPGVFSFDLADGRLEPSVIVPDIRGITGMRILDGDDTGELFQGDIAFEAGSNMRITKSEYSGVVVLTFSAIDGEGTIADCVCEGDIADAPAIRTINSVPPDDLGNINILGDDCLLPTPLADENAVQITDQCSKPCCGCPELDKLVEDQNKLFDEIYTLKALGLRIEAVGQLMQTYTTMTDSCEK